MAVFLSYASPARHALIDRELCLLRSWTADPARYAAGDACVPRVSHAGNPRARDPRKRAAAHRGGCSSDHRPPRRVRAGTGARCHAGGSAPLSRAGGSDPANAYYGSMTSRFAGHGVCVQVPATSANVGPGFDCFALALDLHDVVVAHVTASDGVSVSVSGEGAGTLPTDERNLVARSMYAAFEVLGQYPDGLSVKCSNEIPQERGLGSSAGAAIAGILAARALVPDGMKLMSDRDVLTLATKIEGHADNPAACLLGGFAITWAGTTAQEAIKLSPSVDIQPVVYVPENRMRTSEARALLPVSIPLSDAQYNARHSALLVHAITTAPELLFTATEDRMHQPFRLPALPATEKLLSSLRDSGIAAVLSGAGPSVLALGSRDWDPPAASGWQVWRLEADLLGAVVEPI